MLRLRSRRRRDGGSIVGGSGADHCRRLNSRKMRSSRQLLAVASVSEDLRHILYYCYVHVRVVAKNQSQFIISDMYLIFNAHF